MFSEIYDRFIDSSSSRYEFISQEQFTDSVNEILRQSSPSTLKLLESFGINNYNFIYIYLQSFLIGAKLSSHEKYLFTAFVTAKSKRKFAVNLIAASFIMLHCRLANVLSDNPEAFQELYIALLMKIDERLLVENAKILEKLSEKKDNENII